MINNKISDLILSRLTEKSMVLDIGGARYPWFRANYILDKRKYGEKVGPTAFAGREGEKEYFNKDTWISHDFYDLPWPFEDKFFDFSLCMGTLEDVRDPIVICKEIQRVSKAGYISTPTRAAESSIGISEHPLSKKIYGYYHHRWFVEIIESKLVFKMKTPLLYQHKQWMPKETGQRTLNYFWENSFEAEEHYVRGHEEDVRELKRYWEKHKNWLKNITPDDLYNHWIESWGEKPDFQQAENIKQINESKNLKRILKIFKNG